MKKTLAAIFLTFISFTSMVMGKLVAPLSDDGQGHHFQFEGKDYVFTLKTMVKCFLSYTDDVDHKKLEVYSRVQDNRVKGVKVTLSPL